jgi:hypothetical protein
VSKQNGSGGEITESVDGWISFDIQDENGSGGGILRRVVEWIRLMSG